MMNLLDSFEQNWFNTPSCEAIYLTGNETIIFWHTSSIYSWNLILQSVFLRKEQSFLYSQLRNLPVLWQKGLISALAKGLMVKIMLKTDFSIKLNVGERVKSPSGLLSIPYKDNERLKKVEKGAKGGRKKYFKVFRQFRQFSFSEVVWCNA